MSQITFPVPTIGYLSFVLMVAEKILIIEDNSDIRENVSELLELEGYSVVRAEDGEMGVKLAILTLPNLILCDVMMPKADGHQVLERLRKNYLTKSIPFIFVSSSVEKKDVEYALNKGANGYIHKPFEESDLFESVRLALRKNMTL